MHSGPGLGDGPTTEEGTATAPPARRPVRGSRRWGRGRRTRGVVRRFDTFSVFRVSILFYVALYGVLLVAGAILWAAATATGLRGNVESFIADLIASGEFEFVGTELFRAAAIGGVILVVLGAAANVLLAVLYNLISEVVGGITMVVEEVPPRALAADPAPAAEAPAPTILVPEAELKQPRRSPERAPTVVRHTPT